MELYFGLRYSKIWLGIAEEVGDKHIAHYEWTGGDDIESSITVTLPYGEHRTYNFASVTAIWGVKSKGSQFAFAVNIFYGEAIRGNGISKLVVDNNGLIKMMNLEQNKWFKVKEWMDDCFMVYYDGTSGDNPPGAGWCYSFAGEEQYEFAAYWNFSNNLKYYALISAEEGIVIHHDDTAKGHYPRCSRQNFKTGTTVWSWPSYSIIFPDIAADARYDNWSLSNKAGSVWTFSANITLYSGEKITREFTVNIETGEICYI